MSVDVADFDRDGDPDLVVGEHNLASPDSSRLFIFENVDGRGGAWSRALVYTGDEHHDGAQAVDIDGDGDLDIVSIGWTHGKRPAVRESCADGAGSCQQLHRQSLAVGHRDRAGGSERQRFAGIICALSKQPEPVQSENRDQVPGARCQSCEAHRV